MILLFLDFHDPDNPNIFTIAALYSEIRFYRHFFPLDRLPIISNPTGRISQSSRSVVAHAHCEP